MGILPRDSSGMGINHCWNYSMATTGFYQKLGYWFMGVGGSIFSCASLELHPQEVGSILWHFRGFHASVGWRGVPWEGGQ